MTTTSKPAGNRPFTPDQAKARERYGVDPRRCLVRGFDTDDTMATSTLVRADSDGPARPEMTISLRKNGQIQAVRARKLTPEDMAKYPGFICEIGVGRERVKSGRVLIEENPKFLLDVVMFPAGTTDAELCGIANAENYMRKVETFAVKVEHIFQQFRVEGGDDDAINSIALDFNVSAAHVRQCLAFREATDVKAAHEAGQIGDGVALTLSTLPAAARAAELAAAIAAGGSTVEVVRERSNRAKKIARSAEADLAAAAEVVDAVVSAPVTTNAIVEATAPKAPASKSGANVAVSMSKGSITKLANLDKSPLSTELQAFLDVLAGKQPPTTVDGLPEALRAIGLID